FPPGILLTILRLSCSAVKQNINAGPRAAQGFAADLMPRSNVVRCGPVAKKSTLLRFQASPFRSWASFADLKPLGHAWAYSVSRRGRAETEPVTEGDISEAPFSFSYRDTDRALGRASVLMAREAPTLRDRSVLKIRTLDENPMTCAGTGHNNAPWARN